MHSGSTLIVMRGYPGTGKSTIARAIAAALHAPLIDRDIIREKAVDIFGNLPEIGRFSYETMFAIVNEQLSLGLSVVVDTPLTYRRTFEQAKALAREFSIPMLVVHCQCSPEVQKRRMEGRKGMVSAFQITSWEEWEQWKPRFEDYDDGGCAIDTSNPLDDSLTKIMRCIHDLQNKQNTQNTHNDYCERNFSDQHPI